MSKLGRIGAVKMFVLPRLLYMFRTPPIPLPFKYFHIVQRQLIQYIWEFKHSRWSSRLLINPQKKGGAGLLNTHHYYRVTLLDQIYLWLHPTEEKMWSLIEYSLFCPLMPSNFLILSSVYTKPYNLKHPYIKASLEAWISLLTYKSPKVRSLLLPIDTLCALIPNLNISPWKHCGLHLVQDLYEDDNIIPFYILQKNYTLPPTDMYTYL